MTFINSMLRFLAVLILILFVLVFPLTLLARNTGQLLFRPETIKVVIKDRLLDPRFVGNLARQASQSLFSGGASAQNAQAEGASAENQLVLAALEQLSEDDWAAIASLIAPEEVISPAVDGMVDAYADWLDSDEALPQLNLDLQAIKANMVQNAPLVMGIVMSALPECTLEDLAAQALESLTGGEEGLALCRPPEPLYSAMLSNADSAVGGILAAAPDRIDLTRVQGFEPPPELVALKENLNRTRLVLNWTWLAVAALGALAVAMAARTLPQALKWSGWPLLLAGLGTLMLGLGFTVVKNSILSGVLGDLLREAASGASLLMGAAAGTALDIMGDTLRLQGLVIAIVGLVLVLAPRWIERNRRGPLIGTRMSRE
jgi:hypothetical protein